MDSPPESAADDLRPEYDLSTLPGAVRAKYYQRVESSDPKLSLETPYQTVTNSGSAKDIVVEPDVLTLIRIGAFPPHYPLEERFRPGFIGSVCRTAASLGYKCGH